MFHRLWFCLCLCRLVGVFGDERKFVKMGNSVTINSGLTEIINDDHIQWTFYNASIANINKQINSMTVFDDVLDGRFRDRLKLDNQTGSLTITDFRMKHGGRYNLQSNNMNNTFIILVYDDISMKEGDSVTLNSDLTEIMDGDRIQWVFFNTYIAEINVTANSMEVYDDVLDGRFRDRLKLDKQTGSLTITNTTTEHAGVYLVLINRMGIYFFLAVCDEISVMEGDSVTLNSDLTETDKIEWRFGTGIDKIAEVTNSMTVYYDALGGRFRDRLKLDNQTGSLTITNITTKHAGRYLLLIIGSKFESVKMFRISVYDSVHCCGPTEAVIRLVLSALVGVATVILLVYDIRSRRAEQHQAHIHTSET
ncbi:hypothetical protein Q8A67_005606 [Cirrhinus molitorella]|uniref:Immunoglobulin domain-containing protein n=1 Tax=Cirrhinus molitorella TaxID=172907 RepID=A0AA88Q0M7_9TELE|nr:hypothetical protein Q8A67_005606 [Cirrhinus molitorella]